MNFTGTPKITYELSEENLHQLVNAIRFEVKAEIQQALKLQSEKPLTMKEAAKFIGLSVSTLKRQIIAGMPHHKIGGSNVFFPSELVAYIKSTKR